MVLAKLVSSVSLLAATIVPFGANAAVSFPLSYIGGFLASPGIPCIVTGVQGVSAAQWFPGFTGYIAAPRAPYAGPIVISTPSRPFAFNFGVPPQAMPSCILGYVISPAGVCWLPTTPPIPLPSGPVINPIFGYGSSLPGCVPGVSAL